ncbi:MAG: hypothetical protein QXH07_06935 [Thermoplasmata archaeon]
MGSVFAKHMLMYMEAVQICFTGIISQFWLNVKDRMRLREFVEKMRISYYAALVMLELIPLDTN